MKEGWEMGCDIFNNNRVWLQKNGIGYGGETHEVKHNTFESLQKKGLIYSVGRTFPVTKYKLTARP